MKCPFLVPLLLILLVSSSLHAQNGVFWGYEIYLHFAQPDRSIAEILDVELYKEADSPMNCSMARPKCSPMTGDYDLESLCFSIGEFCGGIGGSCRQVQPPRIFVRFELRGRAGDGPMSRYQKVIPFEFALVPSSPAILILPEVDLGRYLAADAPAVRVQVDGLGNCAIQE